MLHDDGHGRIRFVRDTARQHFVQNNAQPVNIRALVHAAPRGDFRAEIGRGAYHRAGSRQTGLAEDVGDAKIGQDGMLVTIIRKQDVGRFDIAVNHTGLVRIIQRIGNLGSNTQCFIQRQAGGLVADVVFQVFAPDKLHHHVINIALDAKIKDVDDVRVAQLGHRPGFAPETFNKFLIRCQVPQHHLDRDKTIQAGLVCLVNIRHAAASQPLAQFVLPQLLTA